MGSSYLIAGQEKPSANTDTQLYLVPASTEFVGSTLCICNQSVTDVTSYGVAVVKNTETLSDKHWIKMNQLLDQRQSKDITIGMTLAAGDKVIVRNDTGTVSFTLFGSEITV